MFINNLTDSKGVNMLLNNINTVLTLNSCIDIVVFNTITSWIVRIVISHLRKCENKDIESKCLIQSAGYTVRALTSHVDVCHPFHVRSG